MNILELLPHIRAIQESYGITNSDTFNQLPNGDYRGVKTDKIIPKKEYQAMCNAINTLFRKYLN
jgi:hypothetical protein